MEHQTIQRYLWIAVAVFAVWTYGEKDRYEHATHALFFDTKTGDTWARRSDMDRPPQCYNWLGLEQMRPGCNVFDQFDNAVNPFGQQNTK